MIFIWKRQNMSDQDKFIEVWKDIPGFEGVYQVSNFGRVKSLERIIKWKNSTTTIKEKILKPNISSDHCYVTLCYCGVHRRYLVHRLVAEAFIPNPNGYTVVHHKDENPENNVVENLSWMDKSDHHALHNKDKGKKVYQFTLDDKLVKVWPSTMECGRNGFNQWAVSDCCAGKRKTHKKYKWSYSNE